MKSAAALLLLALPLCAQRPLGAFEGQSDIGIVTQPGIAAYNSGGSSYTISAAAGDAFHYVWTQVSGDVSVSADIAFATPTGDPHRKAALMIRQSLGIDSAYANIAVRGDGITSLQTRNAKGTASHEIQTNVTRPSRVRITKDGDDFYISVAASGEPLHFAGGALRVPMTGSFYIGLAVSAHYGDAFETAVFSNVEIAPLAANAPKRNYSTIEMMTVDSTDRHVVFVTEDPLPNPPLWSSDGTRLTFFNAGHNYEVSMEGGAATDQGPASAKVETDLSSPSPDGQRIVSLSIGPSFSPEIRTVDLLLRSADADEAITLANFTGGASAAAWSPDGRRIAFVSYQSIR